MNYKNLLKKVISEFEKMPGIGPKSAERLVYFLIEKEKSEILKLIASITELKDNLKYCNFCNNFTLQNTCEICKNSYKRNNNKLCIVEHPKDLNNIENTGEYDGLYFVIHGKLSPSTGLNSSSSIFTDLKNKIIQNNINEVIIATNLDVEGEATALFIKDLIKNHVDNVYRPASGIPAGGSIEFADMISLGKSIKGKIKF